MKMATKSENEIERECIHFLLLNGWFAWKTSNRVAIVDGSPLPLGKFELRGKCDFVAITHDKVAFVETKSAKGKQSDVQKAFQKKLEQLGHFYTVVHSLSELKLNFTNRFGLGIFKE